MPVRPLYIAVCIFPLSPPKTKSTLFSVLFACFAIKIS
nr:MAG TPA: hypothetical protein [Caudoviricetes sp.]